MGSRKKLRSAPCKPMIFHLATLSLHDMVRNRWQPRIIPSHVWTVLDELSTGMVPSPGMQNWKVNINEPICIWTTMRKPINLLYHQNATTNEFKTWCSGRAWRLLVLLSLHQDICNLLDNFQLKLIYVTICGVRFKGLQVDALAHTP